VKAQKRMADIENTINFHQAVKSQKRTVELIPKSLGQEHLIMQMQNTKNHIVVAVGPAGTGKTYIAMQAAIKDFKEGKVEKLILTRPAVGVEDEQHGFLPGNLIAKMEPWTRPLLDVLREHYHPKDILAMLEDGTIEISPLAYMRGRTFKRSWIIADEMQNATPAQVKMLMTRIGDHSRIAITGDIEQADRKTHNNGLLDLCNKLNSRSVNGIAITELARKDIQRHPIIDAVLGMYSD
jgi:phosphate starvation-inducible PhoH-like protein